MVMMDNRIIVLNFYFCTFVTIPFACGYRVGQSIALIMALDRLFAIWRPIEYAIQQGKASFSMHILIL